MAFLDFLSKKTVRPAWSYVSKGIIWRLVPSESGLFLGEERNLESKATTFFCINQQSGNVLWEHQSFHERWWIGIEAVCGEYAFLHGFFKPDMPQHKGITAIDLATGGVAWNNPELSFILTVDRSVFAARDSGERVHLFELDCATGEVLHEWGDDEEELHAARKKLRTLETNGPVFPQPLVMMSERSVLLVSKHSRAQSLVGSVEGLERDEFLFCSYHESDGRNNGDSRLNNILKIIDLKNGNAVFEEILNSGVPAAAPDSFFVHRDMLYFIKDRSVLTAVNIRELTRQDGSRQ